MGRVDLHSHSTISDGLLTPSELVRYAASQGVNTLALTDHDDIAGLDEARQEANKYDIQLVNGVEISVTWRKRTLHIVGLRVDPEYPELASGLSKLREGRIERARRIANELSKVGIHGSYEGAREYASERIISRTHFARFLVEKGHAKDIKSVFKKYLVKGKPGYVTHHWATLEEAVSWIRESGGVAVIAHPGRYELGKTLINELFTEFKLLGGTAIEVISGSHGPGQSGMFADYARQFGLLSSRGSDYHGPNHSFYDMGKLPELPASCTPVWHDWPEAA
jgi:predicted metal-dependent phosphoesterase TrpH